MSDSEYSFIYVVCADEEEAKLIASKLLEHRLIACANILSTHTSMYEWDGESITSSENSMILKSRKVLFPKIKAEIRAHHSYECPCIVEMDITGGFAPYLDWISEQTTAK